MSVIVSIDPGKSTGIVVGKYSADERFEILMTRQIPDGVEGFVAEFGYGNHGLHEWLTLFDHEGSFNFLVEKFTARGGANKGFSYRTDALEPLRVEGAILAMGLSPEWVDPRQQYFIGGKDKAEKKKRQHAWLKENGYYVSPKSLGASDADDVRSATAHAIAWLRRQKHEPTLLMFRDTIKT